MSNTNKESQDPTKNPKFKRVVEHFLKTPPKPHKPDDRKPKDSAKTKRKKDKPGH